MRYLFTILAATAAASLMALIGASSASATVLCSESATSGCTSYGKGAALDGLMTASSTFSWEGTTLLECSSGMVESTTSNAGGSSETVSAAIKELTWKACTNTIHTASTGELEIHHISGTDNGTVTGKNISMAMTTMFGNCTYATGGSLDLGTLEGGNSATLKINATLAKTAGFFCPPKVGWTASYSVISPEALYIGASAAAAAPMIRLENTGGPPKAGTKRCEFTARFEVCKFTVKNESAFPVIVTIEEVTGPGGRYSIINKACAKGVEIVAAGFCEGEIRLEVNPGAKWSNGYLVQVEEKGSGGKNLAGMSGVMTTP